ncbi:MAG: fasciclin domain-containing protein [Leptolyngbyaceae cyanobacterium]
MSGVEEFSTLEAALTAAELVEPLMGEGPFTVIAPSDDAFAALPDGVLDALLLPENADLLTDILTYHVIPGAVMSDDLETGTVETLGGEELPVLVADDAAFVDGISIVAFDIPATNGLIHVLQDGVLVPDDVAAALETRLAEAEEPMEEEEAMVEETMPMPETTPAEPVRGLW